MATKLRCPKCQFDLSGSFEGGPMGVCPKCKATFSARRKTKAAGVVAPRSIPHQAPRSHTVAGDLQGRPSHLGPAAVMAVALLVVIAGIGWIVQSPAETTVVANAPALSRVDGEAVIAAPPPGDAAAPLPELAKPIKTTIPRVRKIPAIERVIERPTPLSLGPVAMAVPADAEKVKIDRAVHLGVEFLKSNSARWVNAGSHRVGYAALPGLALLEVGVPKNDPTIAEAAAAVRRHSRLLQDTYDISLAILFLDRLGDPADEALIRTLALRLIAGQTSQAGWDYKCPILPAGLETPLQAMLEKLRPEGRWQMPLDREPGKGIVELAIPLPGNSVPLDRPIAGIPPKAASPQMNLVKPIVLGDAAATNDLVKDFAPALKSLPVAQPAPVISETARKKKDRGYVKDDNSNTQFALLALWAARRHGVPVDRSLLLADQRFAKSQAADGSWGYHVLDSRGTPQMTCVGLLGLALGHGSLLPDSRDPSQPAPRAGGDPAIQRGLEALGRSIGARNDGPMPNLYMLWSVERVAMLYQLPTIGGKDWYGWGSKHLVAAQREDGAWRGGGYPGADTPLDTAFALLFLHRSNLVQDLSDRLHLHMAITDSERFQAPR